LKVLIIDDERDIRELASVSLARSADMQVITASSGPEGLRLAREQHPDAILLDLMMPAMDGRATLQALRGETATAKIPVVLMSAASDDAHELAPLGAAGVIPKPFDPVTLPARLRSVLGAGH
jgi:two-component system alkaline phosphatase synthesis response regulator PhoP